MKEEIFEILTPEFEISLIEKWKLFEEKCDEIFLGKLQQVWMDIFFVNSNRK